MMFFMEMISPVPDHTGEQISLIYPHVTPLWYWVTISLEEYNIELLCQDSLTPDPDEPTSPPKERHMRGGEGEIHWGVKVHLGPWWFFSHILSATLSLIASGV